ncbi:Sensor histidine kinase RegB [Cupriavidus yeoncheonensis]|uniref:histidine kinase n=1 Tax=Cupriavidus yeoncheonensis TaxID=1462994 RepID=A0A916ITQ0_9BURK|nr:ATP-binding protein [Cupriavidus yeoncheonensis]CAG2138329.1 Sensor histidine kinase RegB [Cupriavidus yeoncheonensis]
MHAVPAVTHPPVLTASPPLPAGPAARPSLVSLRRLFWLRWALLAGQALGLMSCEPIIGVALPTGPLLVVFALQALFNVLTGLRLRLHTRQGSAPREAELMGQFLVDLTALSAILFYTGGATNPFVSFYLPGLAIAAAILPWRQVVALACYALACYTVLLFEYLPLDLHDPDKAVNYHLAGMWLNFVASAVMIALFVARLSGVLRQREAQLHLAREQLLREARVEDLNAQAAAVAHEIGTPLATLAVIAGELRGDASDRARGATPVADYLPDLLTVEQQLDLCRTILARLREDPATLEPQRIDAWLGSFAERWQLRHPSATLQASASPQAGELAIEPARVGQILTILLDNAARSQQSAGHAQMPLRLDIAIEQGGLAFRVSDHGDGIPPVLRAQLGEAPVASPHGGQGIGLYLAQSGARQMGGGLAWRDRPGGGTIAELHVPASPSLAVNPS